MTRIVEAPLMTRKKGVAAVEVVQAAVLAADRQELPLGVSTIF
jgi:hypothetical protein